MTDLLLARALHVLGVIIWIGGVSMVTTVVFHAIRRGDLGADRLRAFQAIEHRFVWQARAAVLLVGASGLFMSAKLHLWARFREPAYWWMHAMVLVWLIFFLLLFVGEPLILRRIIPRLAAEDPGRAFAWLHRAHVVLLTLSLITALGAMAGAHGGWFF